MSNTNRYYELANKFADLIEKNEAPWQKSWSSNGFLPFNIKTGKETTSAASVIAWAVKWLMSFELVLTGDLSQEQFNTHGVL